jgi:hypothetical protein
VEQKQCGLLLYFCLDSLRFQPKTKELFMRINIFAGPGAGKSTTASFIHYRLKSEGYQVELVSEFIKYWAWQKRIPDSWDQFFIFGSQLHAEDHVLRHNTAIVTESPLLLQIAYMERANNEFATECLSVCNKFDKNHPSINIILKRETNYNPNGRYENLAQAIEMDKRITKLVQDVYGDNHCTFSPFDEQGIMNYVMDNYF